MANSAHDWLDRIVSSPQVCALAEAALRAGRVEADGSRGSSTALLAGALAAKSRRPVLLVVAHLDEADDALEDLELFSEAGYALTAARFGALEVLPGESSVNLELLAERLAVVSELSEGRRPEVLVAPIQALMQAVPTAEAAEGFALTLREAAELSPNDLAQWLIEAGYQRQDALEQPGDFAIRGGIVDVYPPAGQWTDPHGHTEAAGPVRIDYFGDEIDAINKIDLDTMGSAGKLASVRLIGASVDQIQRDQRTACLLDVLGDEAMVVLHEVMELSEQARGYYERLTDPRGIFAPNTIFQKLTKRAHVQVNQYSAGASKTGKEDRCTLPVAPMPIFDEEAKQAIEELIAFAQKSELTVLCRKQAERDRLADLLAQHDKGERVSIELGGLHRGFIWDAGDRPMILVPHHELFHRYETSRRVRRVTTDSTSQASDAFLDLEVGDCVVHVDHGIARFTGIKTMRRKGASEEYLTLEFSGRALLHVPATQIDLIQKYVGGFQGRPPLSVLGGKKWQKQKQHVAEAVKDLAAELLRVQAARETQPGIQFPADTAWQREFEAEFPYEETEDQLAAIAATKRDMNEPQPMDRLICGDVGFGKTEVAIRAAFKAAEFGKQVAVLVPTTVLAEQHERTFRDRIADYPFKIESLSRFKTAAEQKAVLERLKVGQVDIVIGTHRLLSKDVKFADLGLVIIDEEQRFGVEHKQTLLSFRLTADVMTLTATPIPRTLHMSMVGLRDISSLSTAPVDRRAIVTEVIPYDRKRVKQAIIRELNREGQIYFVHNRVHDIQSVADEIQKMAPDARIVIGHGQMPPRELEKVMLAFMRRQADILVSTTIIESGIDIPTANTMFIHDADHFGLAELHQLRGRVGRYKHRAYCYLLLPENRTINDVATKRLKALEQYAMLGAGFKIAMRDLEIRGAGNLLGSEQSGHIAAVGYEMYCLLLERETKRLKNESIIQPAKTHLELPVHGRLTKRYIGSDKYRMEMYRRLSRAAALDDLENVVQTMTDAYGKPPEQAQRLIDLTEIRIAASTLGIGGIKLEGPDVIFKLGPEAKLGHVFDDAPGRVSVLDQRTLYYRPPANYLEPPTLLAVLRKLLVRPITQSQVATGGA